jgi:single-stranded-DNA-specific exonuclease
LQIIADQKLDEHPVLLVGAKGWHPGVIGIVASRLKERFAKPAMVVAFDGDLGKGSGRSVTGVIMGDAMIKAVHLGILQKGGGHAMAAGFTVHQDSYDAFYDFLNEEMGDDARSSKPRLFIDGHLSVGGATVGLVEKLQQLEPFGAGNAQPKFIMRDVTVTYSQPIGDGSHRRCTVKDATGATAKLMAFRVTDTPIDEALNRAKTQACDIVVTLKKDSFNGKNSVSLFLEDIAF